MKNKIKICNLYLVDEELNKVVLIYKKHGSKKFYAPGGKIELNETLEQSATREFFEETNLLVENAIEVCKSEHYFDDKIVYITSFYANKWKGTLVENHVEGVIQWHSFSELDNLVMLDGDREILNDIINKKTKSEYVFRYDKK